MSLMTYNLYIRSLGREKEFDEIDRTWEVMRKLKVPIDSSSYAHTISAFASDSNTLRAVKCFEEMKKVDCTPNDVAISALLQCYLSSQDWYQAEKLYSEAKDSNWELGLRSLSVLMKICGAKGEFDRMMALWDELKARKIAVDATFFSNIFGSLGSRAPRVTLFFYNEIPQAGVGRGVNVLIKLLALFKGSLEYANPEDKQAAMDLVRLLKADPRLSSQPH